MSRRPPPPTTFDLHSLRVILPNGRLQLAFTDDPGRASRTERLHYLLVHGAALARSHGRVQVSARYATWLASALAGSIAGWSLPDRPFDIETVYRAWRQLRPKRQNSTDKTGPGGHTWPGTSPANLEVVNGDTGVGYRIPKREQFTASTVAARLQACSGNKLDLGHTALVEQVQQDLVALQRLFRVEMRAVELNVADLDFSRLGKLAGRTLEPSDQVLLRTLWLTVLPEPAQLDLLGPAWRIEELEARFPAGFYLQQPFALSTRNEPGVSDE